MTAENTSWIRSAIPGRIRTRLPAMVGMDDATAQLIIDQVKTIECVSSMQINPRTGSALILWDRDAMSAEDMLETLKGLATLAGIDVTAAAEKNCECSECCCKDALKAVEKNLAVVEKSAGRVWNAALDRVVPLVVPDQKHSRRARRVAQNRLMLASAAACVGVLATGRMAVHAYAGWAFVFFAAVHLYQHRRVL